MLKVNNKDTRTTWRRYDVFFVNFEHISNLVLVFLLLTLNMYLPAGSAFYINNAWKGKAMRRQSKTLKKLHLLLQYFYKLTTLGHYALKEQQKLARRSVLLLNFSIYIKKEQYRANIR